MKKLCAALLVAVMAILSLAACAPVDETGDVTVVIEDREGGYTVYKTYLENVENKSEGAVGVIENLEGRETNPLVADVVSSTYGAYVNSIGGLVPDALANEYVGVYTSVEGDFDTSIYAKTLTYEGTTLSTSGVGLSSMTVKSGMIILFRIETY